MRGLYLFIGGTLVGLAVQMATAQNQNRDIVGVNHVGISVDNLDEAITYYTETLGFPEAFRNLDDKGQSTLVYLQISKNTFVELQPANGRPTGVSHFGIHVEDMGAATAMFTRRGASVAETRNSSGTKAILTDITDLNGLRIELAELPPESLHRQAMERWK